MFSSYLKAMAVDVITGNWDGYTGDKNNYFLYRDQVSGRFEYIPYNLENSVGIDFREVDWSTRSIYNWNLSLRPLYEKILEVDEYKEQYTFYLKRVAAYVSSAAFNNELLAGDSRSVRLWKWIPTILRTGDSALPILSPL